MVQLAVSACPWQPMFRLSLADLHFGLRVCTAAAHSSLAVSEDFQSAILEYACAVGASSHQYNLCTARNYLDVRVCRCAVGCGTGSCWADSRPHGRQLCCRSNALLCVAA